MKPKSILELRQHSSFCLRLLTWLLVWLVGFLISGEVRAQFATSFETTQSTGSPSYTAGGTVIGVRDVQAPAGNVWSTLFGTTTAMTLTTSNPAAGAMAFQITDASASTAYGAYLNLAGTNGLDLMQPFTLSFAMNLTGVSAGTGNQAQVYFGAATTDLTTGKDWAAFMYHDGTLVLYVSNSTGTGATAVTLGNYSTYAPASTNYVRVSITVDPLLKKYTKVTLSGNGTTTDCTDAVQAVNGGTVPWLSAVNPLVNPAANLLFVTGTNDVITAKFDDILITNDSQWYEAYAPGVILPDQGTIEMTLSLSRPIAQFGNSSGYDFLFKVLPAQKLVSGGKTLMGLYVPSAGGGTGLWGLARNNSGSAYAPFSTFAPVAGQKVRVAMSWGSQVNVYVNGTLSATAAGPSGALSPLPATFRVEKLDPFSISEVKISDVALTTSSLSANPATALVADSRTTLLASNNLTRTQYFHTARQGTLSFSSLTPQWKVEDQSLVEGVTPGYALVGINHSAATKTYSVNIVATNRLGTTVSNTTTSVGIAADYVHRVTTIPLTALATRGHYKLRATITDPNAVATVYDSAIAVYPANDTSVADGTWERYLGHHFPIEDYSAVVLSRMGIKANRTFGDLSGFYWFAVQPTEGTGTTGFNWTRTDMLVRHAKTAGVDLIGLLGNPPPWAAADPGATYKNSYSSYSKMSGRWKPRNNTEWGNYVYQVVSRYKNDVKNWEIWNEVDWHPSFPYYSFSGTTAEYLALLQTAYTQAKLADPTCNVLISGFGLVSAADVNMPYDLLNAGAASSFDTFASHGYENTKVDALNTALYAKKGAGAPHWMTEQMWDSVSYEKDRLFLTPYLYLRYLDQGVDRFYQFGFPDLCFDPYALSPTLDSYVQGVFATQMRKADTYVGKYTFTGSGNFGVRHYFTRKDGKTLSMLGQELARNVVTVSGTVLSAIDSFGKPLTTTVSGGTTALDIADIAYVVSTSSLNITGVGLLEAAPLLLNTSFEDLSGDLQTGGLASCTPMYWTLRSNTYDPNGVITLTNSSRQSGNYAMSLYSAGGGTGGTSRVYLFQDARIVKPGPYQITAYVRRLNAGETALPYIAIYNRDAGATYMKTCSSVVAGGAYTQVNYTYTFSSALTQSAAIMTGIYEGAGTVLIDDVTFNYIGQ
ncbi:MAG: hypothetical protein B9S32_07515 [Verrucomicrobia bacterium Tous-C9LFEB]|nr:MAG: hypothetical protein B9S32_07515 [Verrucomicrobia bacterium Tous-C9LFEB]